MSLFNFILIVRHIAAVMVLYSHSYTLYDGKSHDFVEALFGFELAFVAVLIFFVLSGRLIYLSFCYTGSISSYVLKRALRVMPALVVCIVVTLLFASVLSGHVVAFFLNKISLSYLLNIFFVGGYSLPLVFDNNPYVLVANGSLWTLRYEVLMYLMVPVVFFLRMEGKRGIGLIVFLLVLLNIFLPQERSLLVNLVRLGLAFFVGVYFVASEKYSLLVDAAFFGVGALVLLVVGRPEACLAILIGYIVSLTISLVPWSEASKWGWDYSYGIYIYGFFVQQVLIKYFNFESVASFFVVSLLFAILCGWLSWCVVEKPFLRLKKRV